MSLVAFGAALASSAQAQALFAKKRFEAAAPGYVFDAKHAGAKKYLRFAAGQNCVGRALYQGEAAHQAGGGLVRQRRHESVNTLASRETSL